MMEYLEHQLRATGKESDQERANVIRALRIGRKEDIRFPESTPIFKIVDPVVSEADVVNFSQMLRDFRKRKGISQAKLADLMAYDQTFVSKLENPKTKRRPSAEFIAKAVTALGMNEDEAQQMFRLGGYLIERSVD